MSARPVSSQLPAGNYKRGRNHSRRSRWLPPGGVLMPRRQDRDNCHCVVYTCCCCCCTIHPSLYFLLLNVIPTSLMIYDVSEEEQVDVTLIVHALMAFSSCFDGGNILMVVIFCWQYFVGCILMLPPYCCYIPSFCCCHHFHAAF